MHLVARSVSDAEVAEAAPYFSSLPLKRRNRIVETRQLPRTRIAVMLYAYDGPEVHALSIDDMVSLAAYVGSRPPNNLAARHH